MEEQTRPESCAACKYTYLHRLGEQRVVLICEINEHTVGEGSSGNAAKADAKSKPVPDTCPFKPAKESSHVL